MIPVGPLDWMRAAPSHSAHARSARMTSRTPCPPTQKAYGNMEGGRRWKNVRDPLTPPRTGYLGGLLWWVVLIAKP